jgi:hypothetical protein
VSVEIAASDQFNGLTYFQVTGYAEIRAWVRYNAAGELVQYDPRGGPERLWYPFSAPDGFTFRSVVPAPCEQQASVRVRGGEIRVPAGTFAPQFAVEYQPGACADAGFSEEVFVAGVGLVRRIAITIAGPRIFELAWARVNGAVISGSELAFHLSIDRPVYVANLRPPVDPVRSVPALTARLTLRNRTSEPVALQFPSGQRYDLEIRDSNGRRVFLWSEGRAFTLALARVELKEGELVYVAEIRLSDRSGRVFPPGRYTLEAWLTTTESKAYSATLPFEIQHAF